MPGRWWSTRIEPWWVDLAVAAGLLAWALPDVPWWWKPPGHAGPTPVVLGSTAVALAHALPFIWRRRIPAAVLLSTAACLGLRALLGQNPLSAFAAALVGAYGLGAYSDHGRRHARWLGALGLAAAMVMTLWVGSLGVGGRRALGLPYALAGAAFMVGDAAGARRNELASALDAAHLAERNKVARELHDVLAHQLSAIAVHSGAARLAAQSTPGADARSTEALVTVEHLSREALTELSHLLGVLRKDPVDAPDRRPAPTLGELETLLTTARAAGVVVELAVTGPIRPLSPGIELSAYRIVQESLTNITKHAPGAAAGVCLRYLTDRLDIEVTNGPPAFQGDPGGCAPPGSRSGGRGLRGMRERAELFGGRFSAAPCADGGFRLSVTLPCDGIPLSAPGHSIRARTASKGELQ